MELRYDLSDERFVDFFVSRTGYRLRDVGVGMETVRERLANPALPAPDKTWEIIRGKLAACWAEYQARRPAAPVVSAAAGSTAPRRGRERMVQGELF